MIETKRLGIDGLILVTPKRFKDDRGFFSEVFNQKDLADATGFTKPFVQDNHSWSAGVGIVRGLHLQLPPHAQDKLVRVTRGRILDVAVDVRLGSPTYGRHVAVELSAENWTQLLVPVGFAHGFMTLERNTEVQYKVTDYYEVACDSGILWSDPTSALTGRASALGAFRRRTRGSPSFGILPRPSPGRDTRWVDDYPLQPQATPDLGSSGVPGRPLPYANGRLVHAPSASASADSCDRGLG